MRRNRFLLGTVLSVLLCASLILCVKAEAAMWVQTYGGTKYEEAHSLVETTDGGYALAGYTESFAVGDQLRDFWLVKINATGHTEWNRTYGGAEDEVAYSLVGTSDGGYALAGFTDGSGGTDAWLVKTDATGNMEWNQTYGGTDVDKAHSLVETTDGGYALAGLTGLPDTDFDFWLVKTDASGNMEWNQTYGGETWDGAQSLVATSDGGYALAGYTNSSFDMNPRDAWLVKTDASGNMQWNQTYGGIMDDSASSLVETTDGGYTLAGPTESYGAGGYDGWLVKTDASGNMEWNQTYGGETWDGAQSLVATSDGGYALAGFSGGGFWLVKTNSTGHMEWNQTYGGTKYEEAHSLVETTDGGYALAGYTESYGTGGRDFWVVKTDEFGVVPEAAWIILPLLVIATVSILISKKKLLRKN